MCNSRITLIFKLKLGNFGYYFFAEGLKENVVRIYKFIGKYINIQ